MAGRRAARGRLAAASALALTLVAVGAGKAPAFAVEDPVKALDLVKPSRARRIAAAELPAAGGGTVRLADLRGKVVFLNFWATWCEPCKEEMPALEALYRQFRERGLVVVAVSQDRGGAAVVNPYLRRMALSFPVGLDPRGDLAREYAVWALPATFIIDREGTVAFAAQGPRAWNGAPAQALFESLLK